MEDAAKVIHFFGYGGGFAVRKSACGAYLLPSDSSSEHFETVTCKKCLSRSGIEETKTTDSNPASPG